MAEQLVHVHRHHHDRGHFRATWHTHAHRHARADRHHQAPSWAGGQRLADGPHAHGHQGSASELLSTRAD